MFVCIGARSWAWLVVVSILAAILPGAPRTLTAKLSRKSERQQRETVDLSHESLLYRAPQTGSSHRRRKSL